MPRKRARLNEADLRRNVILAAVWAIFVTWCWFAMRGPAQRELIAAIGDLSSVLLIYLVGLAFWVGSRRVLHRRRGAPVAEHFEEPVFTQDYFGREVAVAENASFTDQHLVLEYIDGKKLYRLPDSATETEDDAVDDLKKIAAAVGGATVQPASSTPEEEEANQSTENLKHLAAAAGVGAAPTTAPEEPEEEEPDVRDLRSH